MYEDLIEKAEEFIEQYYRAQVIKISNKGGKSIVIDFSDLMKFDIQMSDELLEDPEEVIKCIEIAISKMDLNVHSNIAVQVVNLPKSSRIPLQAIRNQVKKFIAVEGLISKVGDILNRPRSYRLECPQCGNIISILNTDRFKKRKIDNVKCSCGRRTKMKILNIDMTLFRKIIIEEDVMEISQSKEPVNKLAFLENNLVSESVSQKTIAGKKVRINGWLDYYEVEEKTGVHDTYMVVNSVEFIERGWEDIPLNNQDIQIIKDISKTPTMLQDLSNSILPTIHEEEHIKHALLLQLAGSDNLVDEGGHIEERGNIHLALVGDPGTGKTYMAKRMVKFWPIYKFSSAITSSGRGLVATVQQDKQLGKFTLVPGIIPFCNKGLATIDELDKMNSEDYGYLNNAMNDCKVVIMKAAQGVLETDTSILATMNPQGRTFTNTYAIHEQINLPKDLLDRFDLIFPLFKRTKEEDHRKIFRLNLYKRSKKEEVKPVYNDDIVVKYFAYARTISPEITSELFDVLEDKVMKIMRSPTSSTEQSISSRIYNVILRLISAQARLHLRPKITVKDIDDIMKLLLKSYELQGLLTKDGLLDYEKIEQVDLRSSNIHSELLTKIKELGKNDELVDMQQLLIELQHKFDEDEIDDAVEKLKMKGIIYEPKAGRIQMIR
jgi:replicative DNA helicase Mcm